MPTPTLKLAILPSPETSSAPPASVASELERLWELPPARFVEASEFSPLPAVDAPPLETRGRFRSAMVYAGIALGSGVLAVGALLRGSDAEQPNPVPVSYEHSQEVILTGTGTSPALEPLSQAEARERTVRRRTPTEIPPPRKSTDTVPRTDASIHAENSPSTPPRVTRSEDLFSPRRPLPYENTIPRDE